MNIVIVVYSHTGNTRLVAGKLKDALAAGGHRVTMGEVTLAEARVQGLRVVKLAPLPTLSGYDALVLGAPVEAFTLSPVMVKALEGAPSLERARVACLVTQGLAYRWLGGNGALRRMRRLCEAKGATVLGGEIVSWAGGGLDGRIARAVETLVQLIASQKA
jgi:hypothetical protein